MFGGLTASGLRSLASRKPDAIVLAINAPQTRSAEICRECFSQFIDDNVRSLGVGRSKGAEFTFKESSSRSTKLTRRGSLEQLSASIRHYPCRQLLQQSASSNPTLTHRIKLTTSLPKYATCAGPTLALQHGAGTVEVLGGPSTCGRVSNVKDVATSACEESGRRNNDRMSTMQLFGAPRLGRML